MNKQEIEQEYRKCAGELQSRQAQQVENARTIEQLVGRLQLLKELYDKQEIKKEEVPTGPEAQKADGAVLEVVS